MTHYAAKTDAMTGAHIATLRHLCGLSSRELAQALGVNPRTVRSWEQGRDRISAAAARDLQALLDEHRALAGEMLAAGTVELPRTPAARSRGWHVAAAARALETDPSLTVTWDDRD